MKGNAVGWFEIYVQDMARAKAFYETVFEVKLQKLPSPMPHLEMCAFAQDAQGYGAAGALVKIQGYPSGGNSTIVYFHCYDCMVEENRVLQAGGRVEHSKMGIGEYGFISHVFDTEGNLIGLHSRQ
jgi:uncharacterized protein